MTGVSMAKLKIPSGAQFAFGIVAALTMQAGLYVMVTGSMWPTHFRVIFPMRIRARTASKARLPFVLSRRMGAAYVT